MMQRLHFFTAICAIILLFGCTVAEQPSESYEQAETVQEPDPGENSAPKDEVNAEDKQPEEEAVVITPISKSWEEAVIPIDLNDELILYTVQDWNEQLVAFPYLQDGTTTLHAAIFIQYFYSDRPIEGGQEELVSFEYEDGLLTVHMADELFSADAVVKSISVTAMKNVSHITNVRFVQEEAPFQSPVLDADGFSTVALEDIHPPALTTEELFALLDLLPWGMDQWWGGLADYPVLNDDTAISLTNFIASITEVHNIPQASFSAIGDAPPAFLIQAAYHNTKPIELHTSNEELPESVQAVLQVTNADGVYRGHLEQTAQYLFGPEITINHRNGRTGLSFYNSYTGMYGNYVADLVASRKPILLSYEEFDDRYECEVGFIWWGWYESGSGPYIYDEANAPQPLEGAELYNYALNELGRHKITLLKQPGGRLTYYAHILPEEQ